MGTLTQQAAFRKDRNALNKAAKLGINDAVLINKMAANHSNSNSPQAFAEAAGAIIHTRANMYKETPIDDAFKEILEDQRALSLNGQTT